MNYLCQNIQSTLAPEKYIHSHESEFLLRSIFESAIDGIITINEEGIMESLNPAAAKIFGYEPDEVIGKNISILMPEPFRSQHDKYIKNYLTTGVKKIIGIGREVPGLRKDGTTFPFLLSISETILPNRKLFTGIVHDVSQLKEAEMALGESEIKFNTIITALQKEKELNEMKSRFVTMASHEFRTPLSTILTSTTLLEKYSDKDIDKRQKHQNRIKASVKNLTEILESFLSLSKLEEGRIETNPVYFELDKFAEDLVEDISTIAIDGQKIVYSYSGDNRIFLDKQILHNVLINLISNAIKYSPANKNIYFNTVVTEDDINFEIRDEGIGIPEEEQKHLFERFFRARNAVNVQGTGLGLHIVKKYIDLLGGEISFNSSVDTGTVFNIKIPRI